MDNLGHEAHLRYDSRGNTTIAVDELGIEQDFTYNIADQLTSVVLPATGQTGMGQSYVLNTYQYPEGQLVSLPSCA